LHLEVPLYQDLQLLLECKNAGPKFESLPGEARPHTPLPLGHTFGLSGTFIIYALNKITCGKLKIKFPDFSLSLNKDLEIPRPDTKLPDFSLTLNTSVLSMDWVSGCPLRHPPETVMRAVWPFLFLL